MGTIYDRIVEQLRVVVCDYLQCDIAPDADLDSHLALDEDDYSALAICLEAEFDIDIPEAATAEWSTVQDIVDYITKRLA
jgi:acyl carrier protein